MPYAVSKAALKGLIQGLAPELLSTKGIRINGVAPGENEREWKKREGMERGGGAGRAHAAGRVDEGGRRGHPHTTRFLGQNRTRPGKRRRAAGAGGHHARARGLRRGRGLLPRLPAAPGRESADLSLSLSFRLPHSFSPFPGPIWTPLIVQSFPSEKEKGPGHSHTISTFGSNYPAARAGQPAECAPAFIFLADGKASSYVAGEVLAVTGGKPTA